MSAQPAKLEIFPSDFVSPEEKLKTPWLRQVAKAAFSYYMNGNTHYGHNDRTKIDLIRSYSDSDQPESIMKDRLLGKGNDQQRITSGEKGARKGYMNTDFQIVSPAAKLKRIVLGILGEKDYRVTCDGVSETAINEKARKKHQVWVDSMLRDVDIELEKRGVATPKHQFTPETFHELELYESIGGFRLGLEIALEKLIEAGYVVSDWQEVADKCLEDLWDLNFCMVKEQYNPSKGVVDIEYVDPKKSVLAWSRDYEGKNTPFVGRVVEKTISQLRDELAKEGYGEDTIRAVARTWHNKATKANNTSMHNWDWYEQRDTTTGAWRYDSLMADVFEVEYKSLDSIYNTKRETKDGAIMYHEDDFGKVRKPYEDGRSRETIVTSVQRIYEVSWIIGTEFIYSAGLQSNIKRVNKNDCEFSYHWVKIKGKSAVELMIPILKSMQLTHVKLQAAKAAAIPKGVVIEISSLQNINLGEGLNKPLELIRAFKQNGVGYYRANLLGGKINSSVKPFQEIDGGIGAQLQEWAQCWAEDLMKLYEVTGITQIVAASQSADDGLGLNQMQAESTSNALKPMLRGFMKIKKMAGVGMALKSRVLMKYDKDFKRRYEGIIGKQAVNAIAATDDLTFAEMGIEMEALPDAQDRAEILQMATEAMKVGKNGQPGIEFQHWFLIDRLLKRGKIKEAQTYLSYTSAQIAREAEEEAQRNVDNQMQQQAAMEQSKIQNELLKIQKETDEKLRFEVGLTEEIAKRMTLEHQHKMDQIREDNTSEKQTISTPV